jgi:hypothetical protein
MTECIAFVQKEGKFTIEFENGKIKRGTPEQSYALHNLLCFGRLNRHLTANQTKRLGWAGDSAYVKEFFSSAWNYYLESNITQDSLKLLINEFNRACDRDYRDGYLDRKLKIAKITRLTKTTLKITLAIDLSQTDIIIEL